MPNQNQLTMFQSTHPHGVRRGVFRRLLRQSNRFQSTHPHGVRQYRGVYTATGQEFQSTHPHGVRLNLSYCMTRIRKDVSIHAPTRGATRVWYMISNFRHWFQSTHPHGVRQIKIEHYEPAFDVSIHAPTRGATPAKWRDKKEVENRFNPRTHTGCDTKLGF